MKNFFYAPLLALMVLLVGCTDSNEIDDGTGTTDTNVDAQFVDQPMGVAFDTNLKRWDDKSMFFSVDPGTFRVHRGSFTLESVGDYEASDYYTTTVQATDEDNVYEIVFRATSSGEDLVDSLEVPMQIVMTFNGFTQVASDEFIVCLPADKDSPYYVDQPTTVIFPAGFAVGDCYETRFTVIPMDANIDTTSFSIEENDLYSAEFFYGDSTNAYVARFYAKPGLVDYAETSLAEFSGAIPTYAENTKYGDSISILMTTVGVDVEEPEVYSNNLFIQTDLMNVAPTFTSLADTMSFAVNFDETVSSTITIPLTIDPGTKSITKDSFSIDESDMYTVYSVLASSIANNFEIRIYPTELASGGFDEPEVILTPKITISYDNYTDVLATVQDSLKLVFPADEKEYPSFTTTPQNVIFASGSSTSTTFETTFLINEGTMSVSEGEVYVVANDYYTATLTKTDNKNEWKAVIKLTQEALNKALGSESYIFDAQFEMSIDDGSETKSIITSDVFNIEVEGRLQFESYVFFYNHEGFVCHVEAFDSSVADTDIISKGIIYSNDPNQDKSEWVKVPVTGKYSLGNNNAYKCATGGDLTVGGTYYITGYAEYDNSVIGGTGTTAYAYGQTPTKLTLYANQDDVPLRGIGLTRTSTTTPTVETEEYYKYEEVVEKAYWMINTTAASGGFAIKTNYNETSYAPYIASNTMRLAPEILNMREAMWTLTGAYGVGGYVNASSTWANLTAATGIDDYRNYMWGANDIFNEFTNQVGDKMLCTSKTVEEPLINLVYQEGYVDGVVVPDCGYGELLMHALIFHEMIQDGLRYPQMTDYTTWNPVKGLDVARNKTTYTDYNASESANTSDVAVNGVRWGSTNYWLTTQVDPVNMIVDLGDTYDIIGFNFLFGVTPAYAYDVHEWTIQYEDASTGTSRWVDIMSNSISSSTGSYYFDKPYTCNRVRFVIGDRDNMATYLILFEVMTDYIR